MRRDGGGDPWPRLVVVGSSMVPIVRRIVFGKDLFEARYINVGEDRRCPFLVQIAWNR